MQLSPREREFLTRGAGALGVDLDDAQLAGIGTFLEHLEAWRQLTNLVAAAGRGELLERHILDSLAAAAVVREEAPASRVLDIGSGAGLPGVPLAIACAGSEVTLLEPRRKRANFLRAIARECFTWNILVENRSAAELARLRTGAFDTAVSRATFRPDDLPSQAAPLVRPGGLLIAFTTTRTNASARAPDGFGAPEVRPYQLPGHHETLQLTLWRRSR